MMVLGWENLGDVGRGVGDVGVGVDEDTGEGVEDLEIVVKELNRSFVYRISMIVNTLEDISAGLMVC